MAKRRVERTKRPPLGCHFLRAWRKFRKLSQEELAYRAGTTASSISELENRKIAYSQITLEALAVALGTEPGLILLRPPDEESDALLVLRSMSAQDRARALEVLKALARSPRPDAAE